MIPTWRSPTTTPQVPRSVPVPEMKAQVSGKVIDSFAHFSHTFVNRAWYVGIVDLEYYARFRIVSPFTGLMYMAIFILTADQWPAMPPVFSTLSGLVGALQGLGLGVAVAQINDSVVDIYTWSNRSLSAVESGILSAVRNYAPGNITLNAVYYIVGDNIMVWDQFSWDDSKVWANDPTRVYPRS